MTTRRARARRRALALAAGSVVALAALMSGPRTVEAATAATGPLQVGCSFGVFGVCLITLPPPSATLPPVSGSPVPARPSSTPDGTSPSATAPALAIPGAAAPAGVGAAVAAAPTCTVDLIGNCISLLPGTLSPSGPPTSGATPGVSLALPFAGSSLPVLSLGTPRCVAALLGTCAASNQPATGLPQSCTTTLLSLCVPATGSIQPAPGTPATCLLGGVACIDLSGLSATPGSATTAPAAGSAAGSAAATVSGSGVGNEGGLTSSLLTLPTLAPTTAAQIPPGASPLGAVATPAVPANGLLGQLGGLHLGSLLLWPLFVGLDLLAVFGLVVVARRFWSAAAAD